MHHGRGHTGHAFNFLLVVFILVSLAILPMELIDFFSQYHRALYIVEIVITAVFTVEFILRLWAAPQRWRYIFSFYGIIDLLSILPFYIALFGTQYVRALRLIRLFRLGEIEAAAAGDEEQVMEEGIGISGNEENVEYVVTHHPILLFIGALPPILLSTAALAIILLWPPNPVTLTIALTIFLFSIIFLWKAWLDYSYDVIFVTSDRMIFQNQHILGRSIHQINYHSITNVKPYYPSLISYLIGYGSLVIETAAGDQPGRMQLHMVRKHEKAAHCIMRKCFQTGRDLGHKTQDIGQE